MAAVELRQGGRNVVVTAGGAGVAACIAGRKVCTAAVPVVVVSTHGAGDKFVGVFAATIAGGGTPEEAIYQANKAAAAHVSGNQ